jgi:hypothetical protein
MNPLDGLSLILRCSEPVANVNAPDHKDVSFELNFARSIRTQLIVAGVDMARLQRASECSRESTGGRRYHVI